MPGGQRHFSNSEAPSLPGGCSSAFLPTSMEMFEILWNQCVEEYEKKHSFFERHFLETTHYTIIFAHILNPSFAATQDYKRTVRKHVNTVITQWRLSVDTLELENSVTERIPEDLLKYHFGGFLYGLGTKRAGDTILDILLIKKWASPFKSRKIAELNFFFFAFYLT